MKNRIQSVRGRSIAAVRILTIAVAMSFAVPALPNAPVASAQAGGIPRVAVWIGPFKLCLLYCFMPGYCCEFEGQL